MENKLHVSDLRISFKTTSGKVQAVRNISFDLDKGETLAIVGESGSGKSVTSKAILGILAGNSIIEGGEIIYDGKDLLKISEDDFHHIRGDKIAMIFQDPMSSLNPIVKIGRQLTEAMILKGKARQRESRANFNGFLKNLNLAMKQAAADAGKSADAEIDAMCRKFDDFEHNHIKLEAAFNQARDAALDAIETIDELSFEMEKNAVKDMKYRVSQMVRESLQAIHPYLVSTRADELNQLTKDLPKLAEAGRKAGSFAEVLPKLAGIKTILEEAVALPVPDFFAMGYNDAFGGGKLPECPVPEMNGILEQKLHDEFLNKFESYVEMALRFSAGRSAGKKKEAIEVLGTCAADFPEDAVLERKAADSAAKKLIDAVEATKNPVEFKKDSLTFTFESSIRGEIDTYFTGVRKNVIEQRRHDRMQAKHDRLVKKGREPDWTVPAAAITDLEQVKANIRHLADRLISHYGTLLDAEAGRDFSAETQDVIAYLKTSASGVVEKVTKTTARLKALKLMEEVGIHDPRQRFNQYPFEFSGGMRQRIVIAIALAANPDILICDEPTTALDVTVQSQILELINNLKRERQLSVIFITHDLGVVANMADRIAVMYAGKIVEYGTAEEVFYNPVHPYTWALLSSMPDLDTDQRLEAIPGTPPNMIYPPKGDAFAPRNKYALKVDFELPPPMFKVSDTHYAATWLLHPQAPKVEPPAIVTERIARMKARMEERNA